MQPTSSPRVIVITSILITLAAIAVGANWGSGIALNRSAASAPKAPNTDTATADPPAAAQMRAEQAMVQTGVYFEENHGQQNGRVRYMTRGGGHTVFLTSTEAVFVLMHPETTAAEPRSFDPGHEGPGERPAVVGPQEPRMATALYMTLAGANQNASFVAADQLEHRTNYFRGSDPNGWQTEIPNYRQITENNIYDGVDIAWRGKQDGALQYDFIVAPNADPSQIAWRIDGADNVSIDADGNLLIDTGAGRMIQQKPFTYQGAGEDKAEVASGFVIHSNQQSAVSNQKRNNRGETGDRSQHTFNVGFSIGGYDRNRPLVIDPTVNLSNLAFSTYLGGSSDDFGTGIVVDPSGNVFVTGFTSSTNFPTTAGAFDTTFNGNVDVFVTKLNGSGSALVYSTYLGGSSEDVASGIAVDTSGNAFVTGNTSSTNFPTTAGAFDTTANGNEDVFVTKLNASGSALVYSTYLGGSDAEYGRGIAVDPSGNAFVTGYTFSTNFPTTAGAFSTINAGSLDDVFVTKLDASGSALVYSTYLGGGSADYGEGIAIDPSGNAFVTGFTLSTNFPTTGGAFSTSKAASYDVFVTKLNASGSALVYSTYLGGSSDDYGLGITIDTSGNAFVTGQTASTNFPTTAGAFSTANAGSNDVFVTKLNATGSALIYSTYLGGGSTDYGSGIAVDTSGNAFVTGYTSSTNFPTTAGAFSTINAGSLDDVFVTKLDASGSALVYSTYLGGGSADYGLGIAVDTLGNGFVTGYTSSTNFPTTAGAFSITNAGSNDVFVTKFGNPASTPTPTNTPTSTPTTTSTSTPTITPTNTPTSTPTATPAAASISGTVSYGNAIPDGFLGVSNVTVTGAGSPTVMTTTVGPGTTAGQYTLTGFGAGSYTVTPTKTGDVNSSIASFDAAKIAQYAAGVGTLTGNQLIVADVSGTNGVTSFDAAEVARYAAGFTTQIGQSGTWKFVPANRNYSSITANVAGEDYTALLMGEVSGNWTNTGARPVGSRQQQSAADSLADGGGPEKSTAVTAPTLVMPADGEIVVPVRVDGAADKGIISYEFDLRYDPTVIQPQPNPIDMAGTVSSKLSVVANTDEPGLLRVVVYGPLPIESDGVLLNLRFIAVGAPGSVSPLTWERIMFNEGGPRTTAIDGRIEVSTAAR